MNLRGSPFSSLLQSEDLTAHTREEGITRFILRVIFFSNTSSPKIKIGRIPCCPLMSEACFSFTYTEDRALWSSSFGGGLASEVVAFAVSGLDLQSSLFIKAEGQGLQGPAVLPRIEADFTSQSFCFLFLAYLHASFPMLIQQ